MAKLDWMIVKGHGNKEIGAVGFIGDEAVMITAFFDDKDGNMDGKVSFGEKVGAAFLGGLKGKALANVGMQARADPDILMRDTNVYSMGAKLFVNFAQKLAKEGLYAAYFKMPISMGSGTFAKTIVSGTIKQFAVKKTAEVAVSKAIRSAMGM